MSKTKTNTSTLKEALKVPASKKSPGSDKNPGYYARRNKLFIAEQAGHVDEAVRLSAAANEFCPATMLKNRLLEETSHDVTRAILLNDSLPIKAAKDFADSDRADAFNDDADVLNHLKARMEDPAAPSTPPTVE